MKESETVREHPKAPGIIRKNLKIFERTCNRESKRIQNDSKGRVLKKMKECETSERIWRNLGECEGIGKNMKESEGI